MSITYKEWKQEHPEGTREEYEEWLEYYENACRSEETGWFYKD